MESAKLWYLPFAQFQLSRIRKSQAMKNINRLLIAFTVFGTISSAAVADDLEPPAQRIARDIEGWQVSIDPEMLSEVNRDVGEEALKSLANHLQRVRYIVPADRVETLRKMPIWIDWHHELNNMQYHPNRGWLVGHNYDSRLTKHVHIPRAKQLLDRRQWAKHPYCILHELAHAYHDQVLGFEEPRIKETFEKMKAEGLYDKVLVHTGREVKHYALSNHKEYFAESTEAYFGVNDFYPFVRAELNQHDPRMYSLLQEIWGKVQ